MKAREIMTHQVTTVRPETSLTEVAQIMLDHRIGCVLVVDQQGKLCGIITETDFAVKEHGEPLSVDLLPRVFGQLMPREAIERIQEAARKTVAKEIMNSEVITATEDATVDEVATKMLSNDIEHIPIVRDGAPVGIISRHDLLRILIGIGPRLRKSS